MLVDSGHEKLTVAIQLFITHNIWYLTFYIDSLSSCFAKGEREPESDRSYSRDI